MNDVTFIIKTFNRPQCLARLDASLARFYPDAPVIIANDGDPVTAAHPLATILQLPFDVGLKAGRNAALAAVTTPWFVLLDDDFVLTERTDIPLLRSLCLAHQLDICGGEIFDNATTPLRYVWDFVRNGDTLSSVPVGPIADGYTRCDFIGNFYLASTARFRLLGAWDPRFKQGGHEELFLRFKHRGARIGWTSNCALDHIPDYPPAYARFRDRRHDTWPAVLRREHHIYHYEYFWDHGNFSPHTANHYLCLPEVYQQRMSPAPFDDTPNRDEWQADVYAAAAAITTSSVIDIGCGSGYKLVYNFPAPTIGIDLPPTVAWLRATYPDRNWLDDTAEFHTLSASLVICADTLEHIPDCSAMLRRMLRIQGHPTYIFSTPERDLVRGPSDLGPPANPSHCREWARHEFVRYLEQYFVILRVWIGDKNTQIVICEKQ